MLLQKLKLIIIDLRIKIIITPFPRKTMKMGRDRVNCLLSDVVLAGLFTLKDSDFSSFHSGLHLARDN